jgi:hypothetical protein
MTLARLVLVALALAGLAAGRVAAQAAVPGSWVLHVGTTGGFGGAGLGSVAITSQGQVTCSASPTPCGGRISLEALRPLVDAVGQALLVPWVASTGVCHDCYVTRITLRHSPPDGTETIYAASWDQTTQGSVSSELKRVYDLAMGARR